MMLKTIINKENLLDCVTLLKKKKFTPGFDGMSMSGAGSWLQINADRLCRDVLAGDYRPMPATGFRTAKHSGGYRRITRLTAIDTVLQTALLRELTVGAETVFSESSFAYRSGRGVTAALEQYVALANRHRFAAKFDFQACFDHIDHEVLYGQLQELYQDRQLCDTVLSLVKTPVYMDGEITSTETGLLQGMPLAPLLCNLYFHSADRFMEENNIPFVRYADDLVIFGDEVGEMAALEQQLTAFFQETLKLKRNGRKAQTAAPAQLCFLGHRFGIDKKGVTSVSPRQRSGVAYRDWQSSRPCNNRRRIDLISDGILRQKDLTLLFDTDEADTLLPAASTDVINVYSNVIFDSRALQVAMKNGVCVNLFNQEGRLIGSFRPNVPLKAPQVTHGQLMAYYNEKQRLRLAKEFVLASIHNTNLVIRYYRKQTPEALYDAALEALEAIKSAVKSAGDPQELMLLEARARAAYYGCYDLFIQRSDFQFEKRTRRPPQNEVNALLSFGNAVLYNYIATEIEKTPLDVRVGFLHATTNRPRSLNLDVAEIFKPLIVDRTVFTLINRKELQASHFVRSEKGSVSLTPDGKEILLQALYKKFDTELTDRSGSRSYRQIITDEVRQLVRHFRHGDKYKAFRQVR